MKTFGLHGFILALGFGIQALAQTVVPLSPRTPLAGPPIRKAPTELFRDLLAASPEERERQLSERTPAARAIIEKKLQEFQILPPEHRELRLRVAELRYFLFPLLQTEGNSRSNLLAQIPHSILPVLEERLRTWDQLPPERRRELLESERAFSGFIRLQTTNSEAVQHSKALLPDIKGAQTYSPMARWQELSQEDRIRKASDFEKFFDLPMRERYQILGGVSPLDRQEMESTLAQFTRLTPEQRERAVKGFRRFLALTAPERNEFLQSIARWQLMTPTERAAWKSIINLVTRPPLVLPETRAKTNQLAGTKSP